MKGCDKQKSYKEEKENTAEINYKVPKTLVCRSILIKVVSAGKDSGPSVSKFITLNASKDLMMISSESIKSRRIEENHLNLVNKMRSLLKLNYNGVMKKFKNLIREQCRTIEKGAWFNAIIARGSLSMSSYRSM